MSIPISAAPGSFFIQPWEETISSPQQERRKTFPDVSALISQVNEHSTIIEIHVKPYLENCINKFVGGQISKCLKKWVSITYDPTIIQTVTGEKIEFLGEPPTQCGFPCNSIAKEHANEIDKEVNNLIRKKVFMECKHVQG